MKNKDVNDDFRRGRVFAELEVGEFRGVDDPAADALPFVFDGDRRSCAFTALRECSCGVALHDLGLEGGVQFTGNWVLIVRKGFPFLLMEVKTGKEVSTPRE